MHCSTSALLLIACAGLLRAQQPETAPSPAPQPPPGPQTQAPPPLPPKPPDVRMPDEGKISLGVWGWFSPSGTPVFDKGKGTTFTVASRIGLQGKPKYGRGADLTLPGGGHNFIRLTYFDAAAAGNVTTNTDINLWSTGFSKGDYLATQYRLRSVKFSYEFLTWPYPVASRRFRLKTLWQVQYAHINSTFNAPLSISDFGVGTGSKMIILPTFGLGVAEYVTPNFRLEANGSGFGLPGHSTLWDADASAAYRISRLELRVGAKAYHFRTSPNADFYMRGTLVGAFAGVRFFLD